MLLLIGPIALAGVGAYYYVITGRYVTTENAYVKMDKIAVSADVSGHVSHVAVADYDRVETGQILFRLDDARYRIALARREAEYQTARQEVGSLRALYRQKMADLDVARQRASQQVDQIVDEGIDVDGHGRQRVPAREREKSSNQVRAPPCRLDGRVQ